jgi:hypothetical protein
VKTAVSVWLVLILAGAAGVKAWRVDEAGVALATYGISGPRVQRVVVWALIAVELGLAGALGAGVPGTAAAITGLFLVFAVVTLGALGAGRAGRPCACFGSASRLGWSAPIRALALALMAGVVALRWLPDAPSGYDRWLTAGLSVTVAAVVGLALVVLALAREVGVLRLGVGGRGALEIEEEGPQLGALQTWAVGVPSGPRALLRLSVFTSEGCPLCRRVAPAVAHIADDPLVTVQVFDEVADAACWAQAAVPGSPYAVALDLTGIALAKGTFNSLGQLESIIATARVRERSFSVAA